jgi:hypothetical protein
MSTEQPVNEAPVNTRPEYEADDNIDLEKEIASVVEPVLIVKEEPIPKKSNVERHKYLVTFDMNNLDSETPCPLCGDDITPLTFSTHVRTHKFNNNVTERTNVMEHNMEQAFKKMCDLGYARAPAVKRDLLFHREKREERIRNVNNNAEPQQPQQYTEDYIRLKKFNGESIGVDELDEDTALALALAASDAEAKFDNVPAQKIISVDSIYKESAIEDIDEIDYD